MGVLYFFTWGLFFIGWIIDVCLIPSMVDDCNRAGSPGVVFVTGAPTANTNATVVHVQTPPPGAYPPGAYPPGAYPPGAYGSPPQGYPPQGYPPQGSPPQQG